MVSDLPHTLYQLYPLAAAASKNEALALVQHVVLLETGFLPKEIPEGEEKNLLPKGWKSSGCTKIDYIHYTCKGSFVQVYFVSLGSSMIVHGNVTGANHAMISLAMNADDYIKSNNGFNDPEVIYRNYQKLSVFFKDNFVYKLLAELQDFCGVERTFGLSSMPPEIKFHLLTYLPVESVLAVSLINVEFHELESSGFLWKEMMIRDFPDDIPASTDKQHNWKELYKEVYKRKMALKNKAPKWCMLPPIPDFYPRIPRPWGFDPLISDEPVAFRRDISMPPELQQAFPRLAQRMRPENFPHLPGFNNPDPFRPPFEFL